MPPSECVPLALKVAETMESHAVWEEHSRRDLNFGGAVQCEDEGFRRRTSRDPMSHRIIEKRRRDRMNSCLADLSRLIPAEYLKRGRGRIEKTEIIEMAIRHMRHLQETRPFLSSGHPTPPPSSSSSSSSSSSPGSTSSTVTAVSCHREVCETSEEGSGGFGRVGSSVVLAGEVGVTEQYRLGFLECLSETLHFLIEVEGFPASGSLCLSLDAHLHGHCEALLKGDQLPSPKAGCGLDDENHFMTETLQGKHEEQSGLEMQASEGEESEPITQQAECQDYEVIGPRELREMLTRKEQECSSGSPLLSLSPLPEDSGVSYKFKNNIKRRFTAGLEKRRKIEEEEEMGNTKCYREASMLLPHSPQYPLPSHTDQILPEVATNQMSLAQQQDTALPRVPVFALHSEHSFYVPLMLDPDTLAPHAPLLSKQATALHPVTISVNFCSGGVDKCGGDKCSTTSLPTSRELLSSNASPSPVVSLCTHAHRHWRPSEGYIS